MKHLNRILLGLVILLAVLMPSAVFAQLPPGALFANVVQTNTLLVGPIGTATALRQIVVFTPSTTPVATAAAIGTTQQTFTVTGLATTDAVAVQGPLPTSLCPMTNGRVSAANTLQLDFTTLTAVACTPVAGTYTIYAYRAGAP